MSLNFKIRTPWLKGAGKMPAERPDMSLDYLKGRALQYVLQHYGLRETSYREFAFSAPRAAQFEMAKVYVDGKRESRVVSVTVDGTRYPIPHWDFVPSCETIHQEEEPALFVAPTSTYIEHAYGSTTRLSFQINVF